MSLSSQRQSQVGWPAVLLHGGAPKACRNCLSSQRQSQVGWPAVLLHGGAPGACRNCLSSQSRISSRHPSVFAHVLMFEFGTVPLGVCHGRTLVVWPRHTDAVAQNIILISLRLYYYY